MQAANATTIPVIPGADPTVTSVLAIVTATGGVVTTIVGYLKSKGAADFAGMLGMIGIRKGTEAKEAVLKLTPEDKKELIKSLAQEVIIGVKQEESIIAKKPELDPMKIDKKLDQNLPRETHETKPQI